jgi:signal transduction histidine kinase
MINVLLTLSFFPTYATYISKIDSLKLALQTCHDTAWFKTCCLLADELYYERDFTQAAEYYQLSVESEKKSRKPSNAQITKAFSDAGFCYFEMGQYYKSIEKYNTALQFATTVKDSLAFSDIYVNLGNSWFYLGNYNESIRNYQKALSIDKALNNASNVGINLSNLGKVFEAWKESEKAIEFYRQALEISQELNDSSSMAIRLSNIGTSFMSLNQYDSSLKYLKRAYKIDSLQNRKPRLAARLDLIGLVFQRQGKYKLAETYFSNAIAIASTLKNPTSETIIQCNLAKNHILTGNFAIAENLIQKSLRNSIKLGLVRTTMNNYQLLTELYKKTGYFEKSLRSFERYTLLKDSIFTTESQRNISEFQVLYETEKKEKEIAYLNQQREIQEIQISNARQERRFYILITVAFFILAAMLLLLYVNRKRAGKILEQKNDELNTLNSTKDRFISILAHDLKNPFSAFYNITTSLNEGFDVIADKDKKHYINELSQSAGRMNNLLKNMLEWACIQQNPSFSSPEILNLNQVVKDVVQNIEAFAKERKQVIEVSIPAQVTILANKPAITSILNNLITNAIKFSHTGETISVCAITNEKLAHISIVDKGIGLTPNDVSKLFRIDTDARTIGSSEEKGTGLGLIICKELVNKMNGNIFVESKPENGSTFTFTIPLANSQVTLKK